jgi:hypothetical protein
MLEMMRMACTKNWPESEKFEAFGSSWLNKGSAMERSVRREKKEEAKERIKETQSAGAKLTDSFYRFFLYNAYLTDSVERNSEGC